jgi:hypothetical protein
MGGVLAILAWLAVFFLLGLGVWSFQAGHLMLIGYLAASAILYALYAFFRRCPWCRMPLLLKPVKCLGIELYLWTFTVPRTCRHCGKPIVLSDEDDPKD